eukprot:COSAG01_NODE_52247_length_348_cov_0.614458_1_plen_87_part_01
MSFSAVCHCVAAVVVWLLRSLTLGCACTTVQRALGGVQSYPSVTKDQPSAQVDFSTGSVGLGAAVTTFSALVQEYLHLKGSVSDGDD